MGTATRPIESIKVGEKVRQDLGDLDKLARSIEANGGLLQPIVIRSDGTLIAGSRRLAACKQLGRDQVEVSVERLVAAVVVEVYNRGKRGGKLADL